MVSDLNGSESNAELSRAGISQSSVSVHPLESHAHYPSSTSHSGSSRITMMPRRESTLVRSQSLGLDNKKDVSRKFEVQVAANESM